MTIHEKCEIPDAKFALSAYLSKYIYKNINIYIKFIDKSFFTRCYWLLLEKIKAEPEHD